MIRDNVDVIKMIALARRKLTEVGIIFDDEELGNLVDPGAFFEAQETMNDILEQAIVEVAEYLEGERRNKRAKAAGDANTSVVKSCLCAKCSIHKCPMHRDA